LVMRVVILFLSVKIKDSAKKLRYQHRRHNPINEAVVFFQMQQLFY